MEEDKSKALSFVERMKLKAKAQNREENIYTEREASIDVTVCPNCGAGRAKSDGLTACAYCGYKFVAVTLTDGLNIKKEDNSR